MTLALFHNRFILETHGAGRLFIRLPGLGQAFLNIPERELVWDRWSHLRKLGDV